MRNHLVFILHLDGSLSNFVHMSNFIAATHGWKSGMRYFTVTFATSLTHIELLHVGSSGEKLLPSSHLNVKVSKTQISLLNPTSRDVQIGAVMDACSGAKAKKRISKRQLI